MNAKTYILALALGLYSVLGVFTDHAEAASACLTPTGLHPMPPAFSPPPGTSCGDGYSDNGQVVIVPDQAQASVQSGLIPACLTPTGLHPMLSTFPPVPGAPCGNGSNDAGQVIIIPNQILAGAQQGLIDPRRIQQIAQISQTCAGAGSGYQVAACAAQHSGMINENGQIIAACASAGNPYAIAVCAAGGMTVNQLTKCANGIGVPGGCFNPDSNPIGHAGQIIVRQGERFLNHVATLQF